MLPKRNSLFLILFAGLVPLAFADVPTLGLKLKQVEDAALEYSNSYQAVLADAQSAAYKADSQFAQLFPRITLEAGYRHVSEIPVFTPVPGGPAFPFGDHKNYSYGPAAYWTAFNSGGMYNRWRAARAAAQSAQFQADAAKRSLLLETRVAYFQVQLGLEQARLLEDSIQLAEEERKDMAARYSAGASSKIDSLSAHQEVLRRQLQLKQAQVDLSASLRKLFALTGLGEGTNPGLPMPARTERKKMVPEENLTLFIQLDPIAESHRTLFPATQGKPDESHPSIQALVSAAESAQRTADSIRSGHGPTVQLSAKASRDYPNGPVLDSVNQQTLGVTANWPIFEGGRVVKETKAQLETARAAEERKQQATINLIRDWNSAHDQFENLMLQRDINKKSVSEAEQLAKLVYQSYKAGRSNYLEVDNANFRLLQTKVSSATTDVQILIQLAILDSLSTGSR